MSLLDGFPPESLKEAASFAATAVTVGSAIDGVLNGGGLGDFAKGVLQGDILRDWQHASKIYIDNNYALSPKYGFIFHVVFDINPTVTSKFQNLKDISLLVKTASLPKFTIDTKILNAYNRPNIVQTKIKYDPVNISFHDDSSDRVNQMWQEYQKYYYSDTQRGMQSNYGIYSGEVEPYHLTHKNVKLPENLDWGYQRNNFEPFFQQIRVYSLHQRRFTEYILVRPIIKSFKFGDHNNAEGTLTMAADMSFDYETCLYRKGIVVANENGASTSLILDAAHYDKGPSPLSALGGGANNIFGDNGLVDTLGSIGDDISNGNIGAALFKGARAAKTFGSDNLLKMSLGEAGTATSDLLRNSKPTSSFLFPVTKSTNDEVTKATTPSTPSPWPSISNNTNPLSNLISSQNKGIGGG